jgi:hypothetical protein
MAPFPITYRLTYPNGLLNTDEIAKRASELEKLERVTGYEEIGDDCRLYTIAKPFDRDEAYLQAIKEAQTERECNLRNAELNAAYKLKRLAAEAAAERIATKYTADQIQDEIMRRQWGSKADQPAAQDELEVYRRAQEIQSWNARQAAIAAE